MIFTNCNEAADLQTNHERAQILSDSSLFDLIMYFRSLGFSGKWNDVFFFKLKAF